MPKYLVNNYFTHGSFPKVGQKQKTEKKKEEEEEEEERLNDGDNNGQATNGAHKPPGPKIPNGRRQKKIKMENDQNNFKIFKMSKVPCMHHLV